MEPDQPDDDEVAEPTASTPPDAEAQAAIDARQLVREVLPRARKLYISTWERLADASVPLAQRRSTRAAALAAADEFQQLLDDLDGILPTLTGEERANAQLLPELLPPIIAALRRLAEVSAHAVRSSDELRPDKVGCGRGFRTPGAVTTGASRAVAAKPRPKERGGRGRGGPGGERERR